MPLDKWDRRFLDLAKLVSTWSKDPSTQTGAVIVDKNNQVVSVGFNGFPRKIVDDIRLDERDVKYEMIIHCEMNAVLFALRPLDGCTLYTYPFLSCSRCAAAMIQVGITRVVAPALPRDKLRWEVNMRLSKALFSEANVEVEEIDD